ncbi:MAG: hypothetical protein MJE77_04260 [Proteobacteria bacterium]|nr:hypothetical protein [Pseudomonadota bacterium]
MRLIQRQWFCVALLAGFCVALLVGFAAGCFSPHVREGLTCDESGQCPSGQTCDVIDNRCYSVLPSRDGSTQSDGTGCTRDTECGDGQRCDIARGNCEPIPAACRNGEQDGNETDLDCGGADCPQCAPGAFCAVGNDCNTLVCGTDSKCAEARCGDGVKNGSEHCDSNGDSATCDFDCTKVKCGDGHINAKAHEECDEGTDNNDIASDACRTTCKNPSCGDGVLDTGEEVDPPTSPSTTVVVDPATCRYDFSAITQLYCNSTCGQPWNAGSDGCKRSSADALCRLMTGNPSSTATSYNVEAVLAKPGICCPEETPPATCIHLGNMAHRGVDVDVSVEDKNLLAAQIGGVVVTVQPGDCSDSK